MKNVIRLSLWIIVCVLSACKQSVHYDIKYSTDLYIPQVFESKCITLFDKPNALVDIDSFRVNIRLTNFKFNKYPLYNYCKDNPKFDQFFTNNQKDNYFPFYVGRVANSSLELLTFNHYNNRDLVRAVGYFSLEKQNEYLIFKGFDSFMDEGTTFETYFHKNYLLLWQQTDWSYDIVDNKRPKIVEVKFCVLKITDNNTVVVLTKNEGFNLVKNNFFPNVPKI